MLKENSEGPVAGLFEPPETTKPARRVLSMLRIDGPGEAEKLSHLINLYKE
jgi:hypothetical protein